MTNKKTYQINMTKPIHFVPALAHLVNKGSKRTKIMETLILQQMIDWYGWKVTDIGNKKHQIDVLEKKESLTESEKKDLEKLRRDVENGEWIWKSADELANGDFGGTLTVPSVARAFEYLVENGFLWVRTNPRWETDRTYQYRPRINYIRRELHKMGYTLYGYPVWNDEEQVEPEQKIFPPSWKGKGKKAKTTKEEADSLPKAENVEPIDTEKEKKIQAVIDAFQKAFNGYNLQPISAKGIIEDAQGDLDRARSFIQVVSKSIIYKSGNLKNPVGAVRSAIRNNHWTDELQKYQPHEDSLPRSIQKCLEHADQEEKRRKKTLEEQIKEIEETHDMTKYRIDISNGVAVAVNLEDERKLQEKLKKMDENFKKRISNQS